MSFRVDQRGQVVDFGVAQGGGIKVVDDYLELIVRQSSRNFPPLPLNGHGEPHHFMLPIIFR